MPNSRYVRLSVESLRHWLFHHRFLIAVLLCAFFFLTSAFIFIARINNLNNFHEKQNSRLTTPTSSLTQKTSERSSHGTTEQQQSYSTIAPTMSTSKPDYSDWRLDGNVIPQEYNLTLNPDLLKGVYKGKVVIDFEALEEVNYIKLNSNGLTFEAESGTTVFTIDNQVPTYGFQFDEEKGTVVISLGRPLAYGKHKMEINFRGNLTGKMIGFYRSQYTSETGENIYIATSKLEPTYARQAFPCFDEPNYKAKFTVQLVKPKDEKYIALSNMDQIGDPEPLDNNTSLVRFRTSVPMSTYVSCFIVCDFIHIDTVAKASVGKDVNLRLFATRAQIDKTKFALDIGKKVTSYYIDYFGIEYPLPKLDMIAIPDFISGAMEHWGLVTYRETALLYDEKVSSVQNKERVALVVAHETAHMWFGNLVTLNWWNDLWLNEGFASILQYKSVSEIFPDWGMMDKFVVSQVHPVLQFDASLASHPIVVTVETPDEINEIFDSISYNKGASVIRMLENAVGEEKFQKAIHNYLEKYKYGNAVTKFLWEEIQEIEKDFNVAEVMDTWTVQMGFPILTVTKNGEKYTLTQTRFLSDPEMESEQKPSPLDYKWTIPVTYVTDDGKPNEIKWFDKSSSELVLEIPDAKWVKFNVKNIGYYRVNYPEEMWQQLSENIKDMEVSDKANLLDDSFNIAKAGLLPYKIPLSMTKFLKEEENYVTWIVASGKLNDLSHILSNENEIHSKLLSYIQSLVTPMQEKLTWKENSNDTHGQKYARTIVMKLACQADHKGALEEAAELFDKWINNKEPLSQNIKNSVYIFGMVNATEETWDKLFEIYKNSDDAQEKIKLMDGLAAIRNEKVLKRLIDLAADENIVRSQDYFNCLQTIADNPVGTSIVWDYVRENWPDIVDRFTLNDRYLGRMIPAITKSFSTSVRLHEMEDFFARYPEAGAGATARKQALEKVANNIKWIQKYKDQVFFFFFFLFKK